MMTMMRASHQADWHRRDDVSRLQILRYCCCRNGDTYSECSRHISTAFAWFVCHRYPVVHLSTLCLPAGGTAKP